MLAIISDVDTEEFLTLPEAAEALGLAHVTLWRLVKAGRLPHVKIGRVTGIRRSDLETFRAQKRKPGRPRRPPPDA